MNDAVVKGAGGYAAIHLQMRALGQDLGHLVADGLITATAAGSTAYSLSAGGPVLSPEVEAIVVTPVCAHSLGSRSLVLSPDDEIALRLIGSLDQTVLMLDGQEHVPLEPGRRDPHPARPRGGARRAQPRPALRALAPGQARLAGEHAAEHVIVLERLVIRDLVLVERAEVEFGPGLNVVTGETGAGKSLLVQAVDLLTGGRADPGVVREGAKAAVVEGEFRPSARAALRVGAAARSRGASSTTARASSCGARSRPAARAARW